MSDTEVFDLNDTSSTAYNNGTDDLLALLGDVIATDTVKNTPQQNNATIVTEMYDNSDHTQTASTEPLTNTAPITATKQYTDKQTIFDTDTPIKIATETSTTEPDTNYIPQTIK